MGWQNGMLKWIFYSTEHYAAWRPFHHGSQVCLCFSLFSSVHGDLMAWKPSYRASYRCEKHTWRLLPPGLSRYAHPQPVGTTVPPRAAARTVGRFDRGV